MGTKKTYLAVVFVVVFGVFGSATHEASAQCYLGTHDDVVCPRNSANNNNGTTAGEGAYVPIIDPGPVFGVYIPTPSVWLPVLYDPPPTGGFQPPPISTNPACSPSSPTTPTTGTTPTDMGPQATGECADFMAAVRQSENSGSYTGANNYLFAGNCVGAYQFCQSTGTFQKYSGGLTSAQFQACPSCQDAAFLKFMQDNWNQMKAAGACDEIGKTVNGVKVTQAGLLGASHLGGAGGAVKWAKTGGTYNPNDGHTSLTQYAQKFGGYDVSACIGNGC